MTDLCSEFLPQVLAIYLMDIILSMNYITTEHYYFATICNTNKSICWKAKKHHDGTMYDGMFIVGINTPFGQDSYHYDIEPYWDMFSVEELEMAPEWDGHTPEQALNRIYEFGRTKHLY